MIIKTVSFEDFCREFKDYNRDNNFTYDGKRALYDYFDNLSDELASPFELDVIAICCEYTEYASFAELQEQYPKIKDLEDLNDHTTVIEVDNAMKTDSFIISNF